MYAMFDNVKAFAAFNAKPHLFGYSAPYQMTVSGADQPVYVNLTTGQAEVFASRVEQFGGLTFGAAH